MLQVILKTHTNKVTSHVSFTSTINIDFFRSIIKFIITHILLLVPLKFTSIDDALIAVYPVNLTGVTVFALITMNA